MLTISSLLCVGLSRKFCLWGAGILERTIVPHVVDSTSCFGRCGLGSKAVKMSWDTLLSKGVQNVVLKYDKRLLELDAKICSSTFWLHQKDFHVIN